VFIGLFYRFADLLLDLHFGKNADAQMSECVCVLFRADVVVHVWASDRCNSECSQM